MYPGCMSVSIFMPTRQFLLRVLELFPLGRYMEYLEVFETVEYITIDYIKHVPKKY